MNGNKQLTVYKASAGSGKTFRLTIEYIKLLIDNPQQFRRILAVTFTNKATEEMKLRILSQLYGIWKGLPDSNSYIEILTKELNIDKEFASNHAEAALKYLIHNYNHFHVETIDSFFQTILRNLARELDLTANLQLELNDKQVEEQAVDLMIEQLEKKDAVLRWIIEFIEQSIENDKAWNVIHAIKRFGNNIFNDSYKVKSKELDSCFEQKDFFVEYRKQLESIKANAKKAMNCYADRFERLLQENNLTPDSLARKSNGIASYFRKLRENDFSDKNCLNNTVVNCLEDSENWTTKTSKERELIIHLAESSLMPLLSESEKKRPMLWNNYLSADITLRHLNELRLLNHIETMVRKLNDESSRFLLSDTQQFLSDLIDKSDSPFVYEKTGTMLEHIMIDEFQDTSSIQWGNFKILLEESMSKDAYHNYQSTIHNLIVGDVKQSIYRWRNADWRLLNNINNEFLNSYERLDVRALDKNFRSSKHIVAFNNSFFKLANQIEFENEKEINPKKAEELKNAYDDVVQEIRHNNDEGFVRITLLPKNTYNEETLSLIEQQIDELLEAGAQEKDIAILVRSNKHIPEIADHFIRNRSDITIISDEAYMLNFSLTVRCLVDACKMLMNPNDMLARANVEKTYKKYNNTPLPHISEKERKSILQMPLTEMMEYLFKFLRLENLPNQSAYVCAFYDQLSSFVDDNGADLEGFIDKWNESLSKTTIQTNEIKGIRLLSIHKSKGLEFEHVIIPYCDWKLELGGTLWCKPKQAPYNELPIVPIDYSSKLKETIYQEDYAHEHLQNCVDNLNLLYVGFTRAVKSLLVIGKRDGTGTRSMLVQCVIDRLQLEGADYFNSDDKNEPIIYEYGVRGSSFKSYKKDEKEVTNVFMQRSNPITIDISPCCNRVEFKQSNMSKDFTNYMSTADDHEGDKQQQYIKIGNVLHKLFSQIRTSADIPKALRQLESDGLLYDENISAERINNMLQKRLSNPIIKDWFSGKWKLYNECNILYTDPKGNTVERRPDRVMSDGTQTIVIDFKFGRPRQEYYDQVREYMQLLISMGNQNVRGYLWFVYSNIIEEVK